MKAQPFWFFYNAMTFVPVDGIDEACKVALVPAEAETEMPEAMIASGELPQPKVSLKELVSYHSPQRCAVE